MPLPRRRARTWIPRPTSWTLSRASPGGTATPSTLSGSPRDGCTCSTFCWIFTWPGCQMSSGGFRSRGQPSVPASLETVSGVYQLSCGYILTGHWQGRRLDIFSRVELSAPDAAQPQPSSPQPSPPTAKRQPDLESLFRSMCLCTRTLVSSIAHLCTIRTPGIPAPRRRPQEVPEILPSRLVRRPSEGAPVELQRFWQAKWRR